MFKILTNSGTLSPLSFFEREFSVRFSQNLSTDHVIQKKQMQLSVVGRGSTGQELIGTFETARTDKYRKEVGLTLVELADVCPNGMFPFFNCCHRLEDCRFLTV